jgi:uridine kinase
MYLISSILQGIEAFHKTRSTLLLGIDGAGGAGKMTLATRLSSALAELGLLSVVVHFDDFYRPSIERAANSNREIDADFDWRRLRDQVLIPLRNGQATRYDRYDWTRGPREAANFVLEGASRRAARRAVDPGTRRAKGG